MCGRFSLTTPLEELIRQFMIDEYIEDTAPRYNIAPSQKILSLISHDGKRKAGHTTWGLVPSWAKRDKWKPLINARSETLLEKPSFRSLVHKKRMVIFSDGFYEWKPGDSGKRPVRFQLKSEKPFVFAALWDRSEDGLVTSTILTTEANAVVSPVHNRMPVILHDNEQIDMWLDPKHSFGEASTLLKPYPETKMKSYGVSTLVNSPKNDVKECIEPADS
ncbi:SOS response-associated peptidase [Rossellomorea aquimaris]|uniref:SOS response-associated peptidase n=1 Tax=Rossellomorea aquimaris TaxID=189382 RepID=UPI001CD1B01C|nr:SOS response-associated peptidase [Rossellomorea aquimaris]MCA1054547.1 SOS response-associated peptidase [Rossellomorea aquimaris]